MALQHAGEGQQAKTSSALTQCHMMTTSLLYNVTVDITAEELTSVGSSTDPALFVLKRVLSVEIVMTGSMADCYVYNDQ